KTQSLALTGYAVASIVGILLSLVIGKSRKVLPSLVVTGVLILTSVAGFVLIPHPVWFVVLSIVTILIAASATIMLIFWIRQI
ncbi:MAG: hypothetical protein NZ522_08800, partial [Chitinophagales bacterium]|nr:hypothetical protein [Chitinophagales bacterium]